MNSEVDRIDTTLAKRIENSFRDAAERMRELPVFNPELQVQLLAWRSLETIGVLQPAGFAGVLITPWCMNLIWVPNAEAYPDGWENGAKVTLALASNEYELVVGESEAFGSYASVSLFSPMADFTDQTMAEETAAEVARLMFAEAKVPESDDSLSALPTPEITDSTDQPVNPARRGFLRALGGQRDRSAIKGRSTQS